MLKVVCSSVFPSRVFVYLRLPIVTDTRTRMYMYVLMAMSNVQPPLRKVKFYGVPSGV